MNIKSLVLVSSLASSAFAATPLKVYRTTDIFDRTEILELPALVLRHPHFDVKHGGYFAVTFQRSQRPEASPRFNLRIFCGHRKGKQLEIPSGQTLSIWTDGHEATYYSPGTAATRTAPGAKTRIDSHIVYEEIPQSDLEELVQAHRVRMRVRGESESIDGEFSPKDMQTLRTFVETYVKPAVSGNP